MSYYFVANYKNIVIENLSIKGMQKGMLGKSVNDLGWYAFVRQLSYESELPGYICIKLIDILTN
ncbi:transposase [Borrelia yangtzensis]|uniref:Transposase n=1 Tax=Borreliella yangtzensis TaxID=683292 RepID=A0ABR6PAM9_9SPIR|nr:hypothetical protein [Borreliella yangtzensis]MBB6043305.1 transposase [Borreliella yangtzensis]MBB6043338.1 transposase [Borreliella yangtzensis]WKC72929.1 hypothetical protein QIA35_00170 [Borreliella yangtzensis]WKC73847.1 hypothetical protein QIA34_00170 [Borreliella yangtzensis]